MPAEPRFSSVALQSSNTLQAFDTSYPLLTNSRSVCGSTFHVSM